MNYPSNAYQTAPQPPKKKSRVWLWILLGVALLCGGGTVVAAVASATGSGAAATATTPAGTLATSQAAKPTGKAAAKPAAKAATTLGSGSWEVGTEVKPGTYTTTAGGGCYWARLKGFDGELGSIIANGNLDAGEHGRLTVKKTDKGLELTGDCTWKLADGHGQ